LSRRQTIQRLSTRFIGIPQLRQTLTICWPSSWAWPRDRLWRPNRHSSRFTGLIVITFPQGRDSAGKTGGIAAAEQVSFVPDECPLKNWDKDQTATSIQSLTTRTW